MKNHEFIRTAEEIYRNNPYDFMTFWKIREHLKTADVFDKSIDGVRYMYAVNGNRLVYYWSDNARMIIDDRILKGFDIITLNGKYSDAISNLEDTHDINSGIYQLYDKAYEETRFNDEFFIDHMNFSDSDFKEAYDILNEGHGHMSMERIENMTNLPVFDKDLWIFVREKAKGRAISLGINVYDPVFRETELEWISVNKAHQGKGVGRMLIHGIVTAARGKSDMIRVGGVADDFYYKCGFTLKTNKGYFLKKKGSDKGWRD